MVSISYVPERLVNHWTHLPEWWAGRRLWVFYLTFAGQPALHAAVRAYHAVLHGIDELDLVHQSWLHTTIQGIAFADELSADVIGAVERDARAAIGDAGLPALAVAPPVLDHDAISMPVDPVDELVAVRHELRASVIRTLGPGRLYQLPQPLIGFRPHVSIAYVNCDVPDAGWIQRRLDLVPAHDLVIPVPQVSLVLLGREGGRWFWDDELVLFPRTIPAAAN
jgi:hypothetical protein